VSNEINDRMVLRAAEQFADETAKALRVSVPRLPGQTVRAWERATAKANAPAQLARLRVLYRGFQLAISCVKNGARADKLGSDALLIATYERKLANVAATGKALAGAR
jgi:hypothetical protein